MLNDTARKEAFEAVDDARLIRANFRRQVRKGDQLRNQDIDRGLSRLRRAMKPLRSELARTQFWPEENSYRQLLRQISAEIGKERRKLWKMRQPSTRHEPTIADKIKRIHKRMEALDA